MDWRIKIGGLDGTGTIGMYRNFFQPFRGIPLLRRIRLMTDTPIVRVGNWGKIAADEWRTVDGMTFEDHRDRPWESVVRLLNHEHMHHVLNKFVGNVWVEEKHAWHSACSALDVIVKAQGAEDHLGLPVRVQFSLSNQASGEFIFDGSQVIVVGPDNN